MSISIHDPDQHMAALRTIIAQGKKRIGILLGAGAAAGMAKSDGNYPLIPAIEGLTKLVLDALKPKYKVQLEALLAELLPKKDIETILSRVRALGNVIGKSKIHGMDGDGYKELGNAICDEIGKIVNVGLPETGSAYSNLVSWITGVSRDCPVEIFTTNYDFLLEEAFEAVSAPYFDGFTGGKEPFFDPVSVSNNDLPPRWTRLWKIHGSLGWKVGKNSEVIRTGLATFTHLVFPEHLKYDQTQKAPYASLFDRLRAFLATPDCLLITNGFSFADAHISARIDEGLAGNPSASVFAFQFKKLSEEPHACDLARRRQNFSVYASDQAMVNNVKGPWEIPSGTPSKDWAPIRATYWGAAKAGDPPLFLLGAIEDFARFFASSKSNQAFNPIVGAAPATSVSIAPATTVSPAA